MSDPSRALAEIAEKLRTNRVSAAIKQFRQILELESDILRCYELRGDVMTIIGDSDLGNRVVVLARFDLELAESLVERNRILGSEAYPLFDVELWSFETLVAYGEQEEQARALQVMLRHIERIPDSDRQVGAFSEIALLVESAIAGGASDSLAEQIHDWHIEWNFEQLHGRGEPRFPQLATIALITIGCALNRDDALDEREELVETLRIWSRSTGSQQDIGKWLSKILTEKTQMRDQRHSLHEMASIAYNGIASAVSPDELGSIRTLLRRNSLVFNPSAQLIPSDLEPESPFDRTLKPNDDK